MPGELPPPQQPSDSRLTYEGLAAVMQGLARLRHLAWPSTGGPAPEQRHALMLAGLTALQTLEVDCRIREKRLAAALVAEVLPLCRVVYR